MLKIKMLAKRDNQLGYTLLELLVVLVVIAILVILIVIWR
ncbi:MAG: prepilin-type N-terminal cleavage/methylation domain-containing protein [Candidatus Saccharimonadales bacterium]